MSEPAGGAPPMEELCRHLAALTQAVTRLQEGYTQLEAQVQNLAAAPPVPVVPAVPGPPVAAAISGSAPEPRIPAPERFSGDRRKFRTFRNACELYFELQPRTYSLESTKVGFVISLLQGEPQAWAHHLRERHSAKLSSLPTFFEEMARLYDDPQRKATAEAALHALRQGRRPVEDYTSEFRRWSSDLGWNDEALLFQYRLGLSEALKDELARVGVPDSLERLVTLATQIDRRMRERRQEKSVASPNPSWTTPRAALPSARSAVSESSVDSPEPMQLGALRPSLSPEERQRRRSQNLCMYCGNTGHFVRACPLKPCKSASIPVNVAPVGSPTTPHLTLVLSLQLPGRSLRVPAIIDSGACSCFIDSTFASRHRIQLRPKPEALTVHLADGSILRSGLVTHETIPLPTTVGSAHRECLCLDVIASPLFPVILGVPWLRVHNPHIDWETGRLTFSSTYCQQHCVSRVPAPSAQLCALVEDDLRLEIPQEYHDFLDVFSKKGADALPPHRPYDCPIELLPGSEVPFGPIYPLSEPELETLRDYIDESLQKGFIRPSTSPAGAPIFFVEKKGGSLRPCVDYRALNKITVKNRYPLPLVPELFQRLRTATIFTKLDLRGAYNLVRIREGDEWKTAFRTRFGHFEYLVMPFGLCNAPATFQHFVNDIFRDYLDLFLIVYLDDILIFSASVPLHHEHVKKVLQRLRLHRLFAKAEKCEFNVSTINFLGLVISHDGISMDPQKVAAIRDWPVPQDKKAIQRFIGFANFYRKFIKDFSALVSPITQLTRKTQPFQWTAQAQSTFKHLKQLFTTAPILRHPDPVLPYVLEVDASESAAGGVLSQRSGPSATLHPVAFFSKKLSSAERNYDVSDRELLAIKMALEEWRYLLEGASHPVLIYTDHRNLEYLRSAKRLRPRQARWALFFSRFNFHLTYRPGTKNGKADALSRMHNEPQETTTPATILSPGHFLLLHEGLLDRIKQASTSSPPPAEGSLQQKDGVSWRGSQVYVPPDARAAVLESCHDQPLAGHFGVRKTTDLVQRCFWWPELVKDCREYVLSCSTCVRSKSNKSRAWGLLHSLPVPERPWQMVSLDFIVELPPSRGHTAICVVVDRLTKMAHFAALPGVPSALETAHLFIKEVVRLHGVPSSVLSDRGPQFTSRFWKALCKALRMNLTLTSAYHPQSNGQTERTNQTLEQYLRCFISSTQDDWTDLLAMAEFSYNNSRHSSTGQSPFYANYGYHPTFLPLEVPDAPVPAVQDIVRFHATNAQLLQKAMRKAQADSERHYNRKRRGELILKPGDQVWLSSANLRLACPSRKLGPKYIGPFPVRRRINDVAYELALPPSYRIHPVFHASLLKPVVPDPFPGRTPPAPSPVRVDGEEEYEVEAILDCRRRRGRTEYLIKWKGYGVEENSWEPASHVHAPVLLRAFLRTHHRRLAQLGIRRLPLRGGHCQARRWPLCNPRGRRPARRLHKQV